MRSSNGVGAVVVAAAVLGVPAVGAAETDETTGAHCVLDIVDAAPSGELIAAAPSCFATFGEAMESVGLPYSDPSELPDGRDASGTDEGSASRLASSTIGVHFDGANRTGASITVTGSDCAGGFLNLTSNWVNRISSTWNGCPVVTFYDGFDKTGSFVQTGFSTVNLGAFSDRANSIAYSS